MLELLAFKGVLSGGFLLCLFLLLRFLGGSIFIQLYFFVSHFLLLSLTPICVFQALLPLRKGRLP